MRRRRRVAVVLAAGLLLLSLLGPLSDIHPVRASDGASDVKALLSATNASDAASRLTSIFVAGGFNVADGTKVLAGDASAPMGSVQSWQLQMLASEFLSGHSVSLRDITDIISAWSRSLGDATLTYEELAAALGKWVSDSHLIGGEAYVTSVLEAMGHNTDPAYDLASGKAVNAHFAVWELPLLGAYVGTSPAATTALVLRRSGNQVRLMDAGLGGSTGGAGTGSDSGSPDYGGVGGTGSAPNPPGDDVGGTGGATGGSGGSSGPGSTSGDNGACAAVKLAAQGYKAGSTVSGWASGVGDVAADTPAGVPKLIEDIISALAAYASLRDSVAITVSDQSPDPVKKNLKSEPPQEFTVTVQLTPDLTVNIPPELQDCVKALQTNGQLGDLANVLFPVPGDLSGLRVFMQAGANFDTHLAFNAGNCQNANHAIASCTDKSGKATFTLITQPDRSDPQGQGPEENVYPHITIGANLSSTDISKIFNIPYNLVQLIDQLAPASIDWVPDVTEHAPKGRTISSSGGINAELAAGAISFTGYSCDGPGGPFHVTLTINASLLGQSGSTQRSATAQFPTFYNSDHDLQPKPGVNQVLLATPRGSLGITFLDTGDVIDRGVVTFNGAPVLVNQGSSEFFMTNGAPECNQ